MSHPAPTFAHAGIVEGSLTHRVCLYFLVNADESLSTSDIALKYDVPRLSVDNLLSGAVSGGLLKKQGNGVYLAGPKLSSHSTTPAPAAKPPRQPVGWATKGLTIDPASIPIRTDVPMPYGHVRGVKGDTKWTPLLDRLTTPGMSASLPIVWRSAIGKACTVYQNKTRKRFAVRVIDKETVAVFRLDGEFKPTARKSATPNAGA